MPISIGVDVGGSARGFHAVALADGQYRDKLHSCDAPEIAAWCIRMRARNVAVDAPCCWSATGRARRAERELMAMKISCFPTPSAAEAKSHPSNYFGWMLNGASLFAELQASGYELFNGKNGRRQRICFETFPQAISCSLAGKIVSAAHKRRVRRDLLSRRGIDIAALTHIDWIDAALCALAAHQMLSGPITTYGDEPEGFIVVPG